MPREDKGLFSAMACKVSQKPHRAPSASIGPMPGQRLRRWPGIGPALERRLVHFSVPLALTSSLLRRLWQLFHILSPAPCR